MKEFKGSIRANMFGAMRTTLNDCENVVSRKTMQHERNAYIVPLRSWREVVRLRIDAAHNPSIYGTESESSPYSVY